MKKLFDKILLYNLCKINVNILHNVMGNSVKGLIIIYLFNL